MDEAPLTIDIFIGRRVRDRRIELGLSQEELGTLVGKSAKQLSKYERGEHRVYAGTLFQISNHLSVPMAYFFEGNHPPLDEEYARELLELIKTYKGIPDPAARKRLRDLAKMLKSVSDAESLLDNAPPGSK